MSLKSNLVGITFVAGILGGGWGGVSFVDNLQTEWLCERTTKIQKYNSLVQKIDSISDDKNAGLETELLGLVEEKSILESTPEVQAYKDFGSAKHLGLLAFISGLVLALGAGYAIYRDNLDIAEHIKY